MSLYYREDTCYDVAVYRKEIGERCQNQGNSSEDNNPFSEGTVQDF